MLATAYFLAKFRFDTAENEPAKIFQIIDPPVPKDMFRLVFLSSVFLLQARGVALRQNRV